MAIETTPVFNLGAVEAAQTVAESKPSAPAREFDVAQFEEFIARMQNTGCGLESDPAPQKKKGFLSFFSL